jgi:hypothetical protein
MKRFVRVCEKIKYIGLLGLPSLFLDYKLFNILWLFWLFGFVGIFYNFPVFIQSLKQLWGMLTIPIRYGSHIPSIENYNNAVTYSLPFHGTWTTVNGGPSKASSHSWEIPTQRYAYDFLILDENGHSFYGDVSNASSYFCYDREVLAPADGKVVEVRDDYSDSLISATGQVDCSARDLRGNYILIRHAEKEYGLLAHLKPGSIRVKNGDMIKRGECIAHCGNSGNSSEPHLHFHLQNGISLFTSAGLPIKFSKITFADTPNYSTYDPRPSLSATSNTEEYIIRGQSVSNS